MLMFVLGFLTCWFVLGFVITILNGRGGVELWDGWMAYTLQALVIPIVLIWRPFYKLYKKHKDKKNEKTS